MKTYGQPQLGDKVWHIDEPEANASGEVVFVDLSLNQFQVAWYDGELEYYQIDDHPDILSEV